MNKASVVGSAMGVWLLVGCGSALKPMCGDLAVGACHAGYLASYKQHEAGALPAGEQARALAWFDYRCNLSQSDRNTEGDRIRAEGGKVDFGGDCARAALLGLALRNDAQLAFNDFAKACTYGWPQYCRAAAEAARSLGKFSEADHAECNGSKSWGAPDQPKEEVQAEAAKCDVSACARIDNGSSEQAGASSGAAASPPASLLDCYLHGCTSGGRRIEKL